MVKRVPLYGSNHVCEAGFKRCTSINILIQEVKVAKHGLPDLIVGVSWNFTVKDLTQFNIALWAEYLKLTLAFAKVVWQQKSSECYENLHF